MIKTKNVTNIYLDLTIFLTKSLIYNLELTDKIRSDNVALVKLKNVQRNVGGHVYMQKVIVGFKINCKSN